MTDITDLDGLETHDCFTITEYMAIDHCGLTAPGESWKAVEEGRITRDGDFPINPSGGLIGLGHPVGDRQTDTTHTHTHTRRRRRRRS